MNLTSWKLQPMLQLSHMKIAPKEALEEGFGAPVGIYTARVRTSLVDNHGRHACAPVGISECELRQLLRVQSITCASLRHLRGNRFEMFGIRCKHAKHE